MVRRLGTFGLPGHSVAAGQKSYWGSFHGDVTVNSKLHASTGKKIGAWGASVATTILGSTKNDHNNCNIGAATYSGKLPARHHRRGGRKRNRMV
jgi:hypothetical protein